MYKRLSPLPRLLAQFHPTTLQTFEAGHPPLCLPLSFHVVSCPIINKTPHPNKKKKKGLYYFKVQHRKLSAHNWYLALVSQVQKNTFFLQRKLTSNHVVGQRRTTFKREQSESVTLSLWNELNKVKWSTLLLKTEIVLLLKITSLVDFTWRPLYDNQMVIMVIVVMTRFKEVIAPGWEVAPHKILVKLFSVVWTA